ncbi:hypothetical protein AXF42_Ash016911 [Apostasia shenzhenica]|uniref:Ataxin-10 domain-containing protein n=1 Tax=Apostasia shenzhenica TaxID=1088818 RepID=A0A2H9ZRG7_9ASPA|nr:hypothetical protein AXF42_Ash016911 [Apostasia shenzhenica]
MEAEIHGDLTLQDLLAASRTLTGRSRLAATRAPVSLLRRLSNVDAPDLLMALRVLRNLCAGEAANQNAFVAHGGASVVASILSSPDATLDVLRVGLQLLGNVALAGEEHCSAIWVAFFPSMFLELARVRESGVCDPLCMVLDTCCSSKGGRWRTRELCQEKEELLILFEIIVTASTVGYQEEWLEWLIAKLCIEEPFFLSLFLKLGSNADDEGSAEGKYSTMQAFLLNLLSKCLSERPVDYSISSAFVLSILELLKEASNVVDFSSRGTSLPTGFPAIDVLGYSLMILRDACAAEAPVDSLLSAGLVNLVLDLLEQLEPPSLVRRSMANTGGRVIQTEGKRVCPYRGFRRDLVSVISNCLNGRKQVQDEVRKMNAIPLLLQQCVIDDDNPFLREWGLLAVRNLVEGNAENQCELAEFHLLEAVNTHEISELGLKAEIEKISGHIKLVNIS